MTRALINKLLKSGKLQKQPAGFVQIEALLRQAILDLEESGRTSGIADRAEYLMAYMAMLKAGRALLLLNGYRPADGAQHKTVVEVTGVILGEEYRGLTDMFEVMRRKRNSMTYEAGELITRAEAEKALIELHSTNKNAKSAAVVKRQRQI